MATKRQRQQVKDIIAKKFGALVNGIEQDFAKNYRGKSNNFLLSPLPSLMSGYMAFTSSFESKAGNAAEACAEEFAKLRYGADNVPTIVNPLGLSHDIDEDSIRGQVIVTDVNPQDAEMSALLTRFRIERRASGRGKKRIGSTLTQSALLTLFAEAAPFHGGDDRFTKPVDLCFFDGTEWHIFELKAGGNLDSTKAPSEVDKLLHLFVSLGVPAKVHFATLYNKGGEGSRWSGAIAGHLSFDDMCLIGKDFWEMVLPYGMSFSEFTEIYNEVIRELDLPARCTKLIETASKSSSSASQPSSPSSSPSP